MGRHICSSAAARRWRCRAFANAQLTLLGLTCVLVSVPAGADIITVCPAGCDYSTITAAAEASSTGDTITVSADTFDETVLLTTSVTLVGAEGTATVIDAGSLG